MAKKDEWDAIDTILSVIAIFALIVAAQDYFAPSASFTGLPRIETGLSFPVFILAVLTGVVFTERKTKWVVAVAQYLLGIISILRGDFLVSTLLFILATVTLLGALGKIKK